MTTAGIRMAGTVVTVVATVVSSVGCVRHVTTMLPVGPGPEDIVIAEWPGAPPGVSQDVAITSLAARRRGGDPAAKGFVFIGIRDGRPVILDHMPQIPDGAAEAGPWQGLYWQPKSVPELAQGVLAATRTARWRQRRHRPAVFQAVGGIVDFFTWETPTVGANAPVLRKIGSTDRLPLSSEDQDFNFNAVALASDGTVYASIMSFSGEARPSVVPTPRNHCPTEAVERGSIYMWHRNNGAWRLVAKGIRGANGLALSADETELFVNAAGTGQIFVFGRTEAGLRLEDGKEQTLTCSSAPDNLKTLPDGTLVATATPHRIHTGLYLLFENKLGVSLGERPAGEVWTWKPVEGSEPTKLFTWPNDFVGPSTTIQLGNWWLGGQMVDGNVAFRPIHSPP